MRRVAAVSAALLLGGFITAHTAAAATPAPTPPPSAVGDENVFAIAVSPVYQRTGLVVAMSAPLTSCSNKAGCNHLKVSHDGGATWSTSPAQGWQRGIPVIAIDARGHETLFAAASGGLQRSDDEGATWGPAGGTGSGTPAVSPSYAKDGTVAVAVAGGSDYILQQGTARSVTGSGRTYSDLSFAYAPSFPASGSRAPALLSGMDSHARLPIVERCDTQLVCGSPATLTGASPYPANLALSTGFADDGVVFAQSGQGIYKSVDGGGSFVQLAIVPADGAAATATPMLALAPNYKESGPVKTVYVSIFQIFTDPKNPHTLGGVYRSDDGGTTWATTGSPSPLDGGSMAVAVAPDGRLFAGYISEAKTVTAAGLLCSTNGGASWKASCPAQGSEANAIGDYAYGSQPGGASCSSAPCAAGNSTHPSASASPGGLPVSGVGGASGGDTTGGSTGQGASSSTVGAKATSGHPSWLPIGGGSAALLLVGLAAARRFKTRRGPAPDQIQS